MLWSGTYYFEYDLDHQAAARTDRNLFPIAEVIEGNLELVAAWAGVSIEGSRLMIGHILDLDLIVERHEVSSKDEICQCLSEMRLSSF